jgi:hypothetical protein
MIATERKRFEATSGRDTVSTSPAAAATTVYALFTSGVKSDLNCLTIDAATGDISKNIPVSGPVSHHAAAILLVCQNPRMVIRISA